VQHLVPGQEPMAAPPASFASKTYHGILNALGGAHDVSYSMDPSGKLVKSETDSGPGTQWKRIISGALTGYAAGAGLTGPGSTAAKFGRGIQAGQQQVKEQDQEKQKTATEDFERQQKVATSNLQRSFLANQVTELAFKNTRAQVDASEADFKFAQQFEEMAANGGPGTKRLGWYESPEAARQAFNDDPSLHNSHVQGQLIPIPHIEDGKIKGVDAVFVSKDALQQKYQGKLQLKQVQHKEDGTPYDVWLDVAPGTLTVDQAYQTIMAQSKDAQAQSNKEAEEKRLTSLGKSQEAENYAQALKARADAALANAKAAQAGNVDVDWGPGDAKGFNSWHDKMVIPALAKETSFEVADGAYREYMAAKAQGKTLPTGAQSMLMLSQHLGTTFGGVKGNRVTKDMIHEHLGAVGISDMALKAVQRLTTGDALSPAQWDAFYEMISTTRNQTWRTVLEDAQALGRPLDYIAFPPDLRDRWGLGAGRTGAAATPPTVQSGGAGIQPQPRTPTGNAAAAPNQPQVNTPATPPAGTPGPGAGNKISLAKARGLPQFKGMTDAQITAKAQQLHYTVTQ
jgi:hypothetical protein